MKNCLLTKQGMRAQGVHHHQNISVRVLNYLFKNNLMKAKGTLFCYFWLFVACGSSTPIAVAASDYCDFKDRKAYILIVDLSVNEELQTSQHYALSTFRIGEKINEGDVLTIETMAGEKLLNWVGRCKPGCENPSWRDFFGWGSCSRNIIKKDKRLYKKDFDLDRGNLAKKQIPGAKRPDILEKLRVIGRRINQKEIELIVYSDMLHKDERYDLSVIEDHDELFFDLATNNNLPELSNINVSVVGLDASGADLQLSKSVREFWEDVLTVSGANIKKLAQSFD